MTLVTLKTFYFKKRYKSPFLLTFIASVDNAGYHVFLMDFNPLFKDVR